MSARQILDVLYQAMMTLIIRLIILLYMEARHLQPHTMLDNPQYDSLEILYQELHNCAPPGCYGAWTRIKNLCTLLYKSTCALTPAYSGQLFKPGDKQSSHALSRAMAIFDVYEKLTLSDHCLKHILTALKTHQVGSAQVYIDFESLETEAIGLLYQSLLDFQLCWDEQGLSLVQRERARKGSGTFYTPSELVRIMTQRTLEPLAYIRNREGIKIPRAPEEILALKICDPACGSGFFLLATLRYLTTAMCHAYLVHRCTPLVTAEQKENIRKLVAEHCLYGVDLCPLTVELARISLWIETGVQVPLTLLDQHIKAGNALVGTWSHLYKEYPLMAWSRESADDNHTNGVYHPARKWSADLLKMRTAVIKPQFKQLLAHPLEHTDSSISGHTTNEERKRLFDRWCAIWFWPYDQLQSIPTPATFSQVTPATEQLSARLAEEIGFFHWELAFPEVFGSQQWGFDAILTNPPWEMLKPCSREFFQHYEPNYINYGKQEALAVQRRLFEQDKTIEYGWLAYQAYFKNIANWIKHIASPTGDPTAVQPDTFVLSSGLLEEPLQTNKYSEPTQNQGAEDNTQPLFSYQGTADLNNYKLFLELAHFLLKRHGQLGVLVPAAIYTDQGTVALRRLFLEQCDWRLLFGFINRRHIFAIHRSFKFAVLVLEKGSRTEQLELAFNQEKLSALEDGQPLLSLPRQQIATFSPASQTIIELQSHQDLAILEKVYAHGVLLGEQTEQSWRLQYAREFDMTNDSHLFAPIEDWQSGGYLPDIFGHALNGLATYCSP
ncbi:Eco57I restriction-modification methylase domain-containing protein [Dictyobacter kobayashii]|uniref:site-specific DNA-methyltransferase (adenine-specific) n=1 Tax=Dictyobacter kobayashii TaxID=2014872 RepID=A0A402AW65_9CHLR|nr:N-6 DNA methylase [Dictyobacter kobayashii]GCE23336.1 hypothetical protein KDK_71360 [Dictyobacter kobayashii]